MTEHGQQLPNSTNTTNDGQPKELRESTDAWIRRAMLGIRQMHLDENARREVAERLF
ncbi:hypothetical protein [Ralstonia flaminis]|jgi:hypothetical protein|uniref:Uncharacterized protein n=1 Tax=Ralstonia flaminis TaxID=3058597 RepID=A0ABM9KDP8_9RALS|nr:hypothetical protein [Ralstonia sp. LMG 18101]CAJ0822885.1 hypothetical protein LMG18101_05241 [Ralstonia sp. LMG 18101]